MDAMSAVQGEPAPEGALARGLSRAGQVGSHYPGAATGCIASLTSPSRVSLPRYGSQVALRIVLFEVCSAFTRVTACTLALSPYFVTRYPKASATSLPP